MEEAIRFVLRSGCKEENAKVQGCKGARKTPLKGSGSRGEIRLLGSKRKGARVQSRKEDPAKG
jgi:hypothetical protein